MRSPIHHLETLPAHRFPAMRGQHNPFNNPVPWMRACHSTYRHLAKTRVMMKFAFAVMGLCLMVTAYDGAYSFTNMHIRAKGSLLPIQLPCNVLQCPARQAPLAPGFH